ncbi:hypothetical protein [Cereibacter sphaeroides]|nr:hypothetical protein [Cereibacter sphaeroides]
MAIDNDAVEILIAARRVANFACLQGVPADSRHPRACYQHMGAILVDTTLQAGLNYANVVRPRVTRALALFPEATTIGALIEIVESGKSAAILNWQHPLKISRFERIVNFLHRNDVRDSKELRRRLSNKDFCALLQDIHGVGPKTVDYMACLVGVESIAVDRHIRSFAQEVGILDKDYSFLKHVFCAAADLLAISRREFDAWVWRHEVERKSPQMAFSF